MTVRYEQLTQPPPLETAAARNHQRAILLLSVGILKSYPLCCPTASYTSNPLQRKKPHGCRHTSSRRAFRCVGNISRRSPNDTSLRKAMPCKHRHVDSNTNTNHAGPFTHLCLPIDAVINSADTDCICITTSLPQHTYDHQCDQACHLHKNTWTEHQLQQPLPTWPTLDTAAQ